MEELRERVARACRVLGKLELTKSASGHISARAPGTETLLIRARSRGITTCGTGIEVAALTAIELNPIPKSEIALITSGKKSKNAHSASLWRFYCRQVGEDS